MIHRIMKYRYNHGNTMRWIIVLMRYCGEVKALMSLECKYKQRYYSIVFAKGQWKTLNYCAGIIDKNAALMALQIQQSLMTFLYSSQNLISTINFSSPASDSLSLLKIMMEGVKWSTWEKHFSSRRLEGTSCNQKQVQGSHEVNLSIFQIKVMRVEWTSSVEENEQLNQ